MVAGVFWHGKFLARVSVTAEWIMIKPFFNFVEWKKNKDNIFCVNENTTYAQLKEEIEKTCGELKGIISKKDRVMVKFSNCAKAVVYFYAIDKLGGVMIPLHDFATEQETKYMIDEVQANAFVSKGGAERLGDEKDAGFLPEDASMIFYTSGTTGKPKGIVHTRQSIFTPCFEEGKAYSITGNDVVGGNPSLSFTYGFGAFAVIPLLFGASVSFFDSRISAENPKVPIKTVTYCAKLLESITEHKITVLYSIPTVYRVLLEILLRMPQKYDLSSLRLLITAGEPMGVPLHKRLKETFSHAGILEHLGCTESFHAIASNTVESVRPGSFGKKMSCFDIKVVDEKGNECPPMKSGNLVYKGPSGNHIGKDSGFQDQWRYTGDVVHRDEEGFFWFESRNDDLIKTAGYLVSPSEIEAVLTAHKAVLEAVVVGLPDFFVNQKIGAVVVLKDAAEQPEKIRENLIRFAGERLPPYKIPYHVMFAESVPRNKRGKIVRKDISAMFSDSPV